MTHSDDRSTDPEVVATTGLEPGGGVPPGETPPMSDQLSGAEGTRDHTPNQSPVAGNRTPMVIALGVLGLIVLLVVVGLVAQVVTLL